MHPNPIHYCCAPNQLLFGTFSSSNESRTNLESRLRYELPVQSAIASPAAGATVDAADGELDVKGWAWAGGGRAVVRVDVSADGGATWHTASLGDGAQQPPLRAWAWTLWECAVPLPAAGGAVELAVRAVDAAGNAQPERPAPIWNLRGLNNNSWHRVGLQVVAEASEASESAEGVEKGVRN